MDPYLNVEVGENWSLVVDKSLQITFLGTLSLLASPMLGWWLLEIVVYLQMVYLIGTFQIRLLKIHCSAIQKVKI